MANYRNSLSRVFWGLFLILIGVLFLFDRIGRLDFWDFIGRYWPLILVAAGLWNLIVNGFRDAAGGLLLIIVGGLFMFDKLDILGRSPWQFIWPILIILLGVWVLLGIFQRRTGAKFPGIKADDLDAFVMFSGLNRRIESQNFRGGKATAIMGGIELDFTQARLAEGRAAVELTAIMGGIDVRVPRNFRVEVEGHPFLGGIEDKHAFEAGAGGDQTLHIKASAVMGGIEIKN